MTDSDTQQLEVALPGEWVLKKVFGPTLSQLGNDLGGLYAKGRDKIIAAAIRKIEDEDQKAPNLRVARDVLWNGAFSDDDICAEYFGGILASSRTIDGKDESSIQFVSVIKSLPPQQLRFHYLIYRALNEMLRRDHRSINVAQGTEINNSPIWMATRELMEAHAIEANSDSNALWRHGLLHQYKVDRVSSGSQVLFYTMVRPTSFGVMLYAAAHNKWHLWTEFPSIDLGAFEGIAPLSVYASNLTSLQNLAGLPPETGVDPGAGSPTPGL